MSMESTTLARVITADELEGLLGTGPGVRLLDVRTPGEYEAAHIRGSYNVPLDSLGEHVEEIRAHIGEPVVLICQSGTRARRAEEALKTAGMPNLHVLDGGVNGWLSAGKPAIEGTPRMSLERQVRIVAGALVAMSAALALLVDPMFALIALGVGSGLVFAGVTDTCAMGMLLARLPHNRTVTCDVDAMVRALKAGAPPTGLKKAAGAGRASVSSCGA
ncbi:MAG: rhodanese-like domain-containing protein [Gemmatimonadota bacterium]